MEIVDTTVVNVALPHIAGSLASSADETTWVLTAYLVSNAIILPITGWLAGPVRPQALPACSAWSCSPSVPCCAARPPVCRKLIVFRIIQGARRRRLAAHLPGHPAGDLPGAGAGHGHGHLGHRGDHRPHRRSGHGWLGHRQPHLALGLLHQPAHRHLLPAPHLAVHLRPGIHPAPAGRRHRLLGAGAPGAWGWAPCRWSWTKGEREDWFSSAFITRLAIIAAVALICPDLAGAEDRAPRGGPAPLQGAELRLRGDHHVLLRVRPLRQHHAPAPVPPDPHGL